MAEIKTHNCVRLWLAVIYQAHLDLTHERYKVRLDAREFFKKKHYIHICRAIDIEPTLIEDCIKDGSLGELLRLGGIFDD